ncbi:MAG: SRPBCC family protein [Patescibacteria group bacterium]|nr:SRPBCC family protein [Patescibacteria group bacterium]
MITLKHSTEIKTTPENIYNWFKNINKNYKKWHPDHVKWINETGGLGEGDIVYYEEYVHGKLHSNRSKITKIEENKKVEFKNLFPVSIICPKGSFSIEQKGETCIFTATFFIRFGWFFSRFAKQRLDAGKEHLREEGENLKRLLEKGEI